MINKIAKSKKKIVKNNLKFFKLLLQLFFFIFTILKMRATSKSASMR